MPSITVGPLSNFSTLSFSTAVQGTFAAQLAQSIATTINAGAANGSLNQFVAPAGIHAVNGTAVAGEDARGFGGIATFRGTTSPQTLFVDGADQYIVVDSSVSPVSIQGGAAGGSLISGAGRGLTYTNITPTGNLTDQIVLLGGNNLIQTAFAGGGNYNVQAGDGNDTVNILTGNGTVNAGIGSNQINLGTGSSLIFSEGFDTITGVGFGSSSGTDTVAIGSGQTLINSGGTSFLVGDNSPNAVNVILGSGVDTVNVGAGAAGATVTGIYSSSTLTGIGAIIGQDLGSGDAVSVTGNGNATLVVKRAGNDLISAQGSRGANMLTAGAGNDTLLAGQGTDTIAARKGLGLFVSGNGGSTTFSFTSGTAGGSDTISGLKATDVLSFNGYGSNPLGIATGAGNVFSLADGTTLTFQGAVPVAKQIVTS